MIARAVYRPLLPVDCLSNLNWVIFISRVLQVDKVISLPNAEYTLNLYDREDEKSLKGIPYHSLYTISYVVPDYTPEWFSQRKSYMSQPNNAIRNYPKTALEWQSLKNAGYMNYCGISNMKDARLIMQQNLFNVPIEVNPTHNLNGTMSMDLVEPVKLKEFDKVWFNQKKALFNFVISCDSLEKFMQCTQSYYAKQTAPKEMEHIC